MRRDYSIRSEFHSCKLNANPERGSAKTDEWESGAVKRYFNGPLQGVELAVQANQLGIERALRVRQQTGNFGIVDA